MLENELRNRLLLSLPDNVYLFRNNVGAVKAGTRFIRYGLGKGSSDLIGFIIIDGLAFFAAVELKTENDRLSKEQRSFLELIKRSGGFSIECRSVEQFAADLAIFEAETRSGLKPAVSRNRQDLDDLC